MKIILDASYKDRKTELERLNRKIAEVEKILRTPERTVEDIVTHIKLLKEKRELENFPLKIE